MRTMSIVASQVEAARRLLRRLIEASGSTCLQLDQKLGFGRGTLGRLLRGEHRLTLEHILSILEAIDVDAAFFFSTLLERRAKRPYEPVSYEDLRKVLDRHGLALTRKVVSGPRPPLDPDEVDARFDEAVRQVMLQHAAMPRSDKS
jgi:hypothetical protein